MKKTYTEKRAVIGGGFNSYLMEETDEWRGQTLGAELNEAHGLQTIDVEHYDDEDEEGIKFGRRWVKKSLVKAITWQTDSFGVRIVARVTFSRPL
jgi:hypothetical protein